MVELAALRADEDRLQGFVDTYLQRKRDGASPQLQKRHFAGEIIDVFPYTQTKRLRVR